MAGLLSDLVGGKLTVGFPIFGLLTSPSAEVTQVRVNVPGPCSVGDFLHIEAACCFLSATTPTSHLRQTPAQTWRSKEHHLSGSLREFVFEEPQLVSPILPCNSYKDLPLNLSHLLTLILSAQNEVFKVTYNLSQYPITHMVFYLTIKIYSKYNEIVTG